MAVFPVPAVPRRSKRNGFTGRPAAGPLASRDDPDESSMERFPHDKAFNVKFKFERSGEPTEDELADADDPLKTWPTTTDGRTLAALVARPTALLVRTSVPRVDYCTFRLWKPLSTRLMWIIA